MVEPTGEPESRAKRTVTLLLWVWMSLAAFFAMLSGMAAAGCSDSTCDSRVSTAWLLLMGCQAAIVVVGVAVGPRLTDRNRIRLLVGLAVVSPLTIVAFAEYIDQFF